MAAQGKEIVLITGSNTGIGLEIARKLLREHGDRFYVLVGARTPSKGEAAVKELHEQGFTGCEVLSIDVSDDDSITKAAKTVEQKFGKLDVLHSNVCALPRSTDSLEIESSFRDTHLLTRTPCRQESPPNWTCTRLANRSRKQ